MISTDNSLFWPWKAVALSGIKTHNLQMIPNLNVRYLWMANGSWMANGFSFGRNFYLKPFVKGEPCVIESKMEFSNRAKPKNTLQVLLSAEIMLLISCPNCIADLHSEYFFQYECLRIIYIMGYKTSPAL